MGFSIGDIDLSLLPLLLLATPSPIPPIHVYTALNDGASSSSSSMSYTDSLLLCLGMQTALVPAALNEGEFPACAAMTTGYVFRVENAATVMFLQRVGRPGCLVTLQVGAGGGGVDAGDGGVYPRREERRTTTTTTTLKSVPVVTLIGMLAWSIPGSGRALLATTALLVLSRALAILSLRVLLRSSPRAWHGASEPGVRGDLLVLLSEDRWIRMQGLVDDLKAVTSGSWLPRRPDRPKELVVDALQWTSRMLVYFAVVALANARDVEKVVLMCAVLLSHGGLAWCNSQTKELVMNGRRVRVVDSPASVKKYSRRLEMAEELIREMGRSDFAVRLGLINPKKTKQRSKGDDDQETGTEVVTM